MLSHMEYKKTLAYIGGILLATGGPITLFSASDLASGAKRSWFGGTPSAAVAAPRQADAALLPPTSDLAADSTSPALVRPLAPIGAPVATWPPPSLGEALDFNVTVDWVMRRWSRVSTGLPRVQLQGYRVPLMSGTRLADVAGSLTYYFNARQQVQEITLHGTTGDPSALVALLANHYHFARRLTNDPAVVLYEAVDSSNQPAGTLKIRSAQVIKASQPYNRFEVDLAMDRPE